MLKKTSISNIKKSKIFIFHTSLIGISKIEKGGVLFGVELVIQRVYKLLKKNNYDVIFITGTVFKNNYKANLDIDTPLVILEDLSPFNHKIGKQELNNYIKKNEKLIQKLSSSLYSLIGQNIFLAFNTLNSYSHNPLCGLVVKNLSKSLEHCFLWNFDARGTTAENLKKFAPNISSKTQYIFSSKIKSNQILNLIIDSRIFENEKYIHLLNPPVFEESSDNIPNNYFSISPNLDMSIFALNPFILEKYFNSLFSNTIQEKIFTVTIPARIVTQKNLINTIKIFKLLSSKNSFPIRLIITGPPDLRKLKNIKYFNLFEKFVYSINSSSHSIFQVIPLMGVPRKYLPFIIENSDVISCLFRDEGWGLPPIEAALLGKTSIISDDAILLETTGEHAYVLKEKDQILMLQKPLSKESNNLYKKLFDFLHNKKKQNLILSNLQRKINKEYSITIMEKNLLNIINTNMNEV